MNLYNDNDPKACAWLAELVAEFVKACLESLP